ncbi:hypothetical protein G6O67_000210 [Ophiocordyceps sinensis]|uniref:Uncharacterized protein n=2 Tax=Ophiocordyceps sinensis TaxID=72228 RepID=A0A8H4PYM8_9HYPO|nr:hypothetical protein OCS_04514 [Ophiocordyceps sinensis CO18]KAF4512879.1 hypothetical protein G6O67_000210 [Ophiocordyceps sinensis]
MYTTLKAAPTGPHGSGPSSHGRKRAASGSTSTQKTPRCSRGPRGPATSSRCSRRWRRGPAEKNFPEEHGYEAARDDFNDRLQDAKFLFLDRQETYQYQLDCFMAREEVMIQIGELIQTSICKGLQGETLLQPTPRDKIKVLKERLLI